MFNNTLNYEELVNGINLISNTYLCYLKMKKKYYQARKINISKQYFQQSYNRFRLARLV